MNQGKLDVVKQETARRNINILGISELKGTGVSEFNLNDHCIFYWRQESHRRNGAALIINKRATVFPVVMYGCESWTIKKAGH